MTTAHNKAEAQVARAQAALDDALAAGIDTTAARADLAAAEARLAELRICALQDEPEDDALRLEAERLAAEAAAEIQESIAALCAIPVPVVTLDPAIAAMRLRADALGAREGEAARVHAAKVDALRDRLAALEATLAGIVTRRAEGDQRPDDAQQIGMTSLDIDAMQKLIVRTEADAPHVTDRSDARAAWITERLDATHRARQAVIASLQARLIEVATAEPRAPFGRRTKVDSRIQALIRTGVWG